MKSKVLFMLMIATVLAAAATVKAVVILPAGVDEYRIIFTTADTFHATNATIGWYNDQVTYEAEFSIDLYALSIEHDLDWYCVGSTETVDARDNISPGIAWDAEKVPIYNTRGELVANNLADLFDGSLASAGDGVAFDQWGEFTYKPSVEVWTGTDQYGVADTGWGSGYGGPLGSTSVTIGDYCMQDEAWLEWAWDDPQWEQHYLYGISSPVPEPATLGLIGLFTGGLWLARRFFTV